MRLTQSLIDAIVNYETPAGWVVVQSRKRIGVSSVNGSGLADLATNVIRTPTLNSVYALLIFLHECGHVKLNHFKNAQDLRHVEEFEAWRFALHHARLYGIDVPPSSIAEIRRRVRDSIEIDERNGRPIRPVIRRWTIRKRR
jgi:hypothetical protein